MVGAIIGNYKIVSKVGEGGMGVVYKALDLKLERFVALKILNQQTSQSAQFIERFKREARNQAKLNHPNIIPVYGFIDEVGYLGIVMEFVDGETLEQIIDRKGKLELDEAVNFLKQILRGVGYAHSKGFIHRDIKPSNVIIDTDGVAKIMDFGISKSIYEKGITKTGTKIGTLLYMSPEQINAEEPTRQSDIYSIGISFYEMVVGITPFEFPTEFEIMQGHLKKIAPKISASVPGTPSDYDKITMKALEKDQNRRYISCEDYLQDLELVSSTGRNTATSTREKPSFDPDQGSKIKKSITFGILLVVILSAIIGIVYLFYSVLKDSEIFTKKGDTSSDTTFSYTSNPDYVDARNITNLVSNSTHNLNGIAFINNSTALAVGDSGTVIRSDDGGTNWILLPAPGPYNITSVSATSEAFFAVGENGTIYRSGDRGDTWDIIQSNTTEALFSIRFFSNNKAIVTGANGVILISDNNGNTFRRANSNTTNLIYSADFADERTGYAVGWRGVFLKTDDGGMNWSVEPAFTERYLRDVRAIDKETIISCGANGEIYRSKNAGSSWKKIETNTLSALISLEFMNSNTGVIVTGKGDFLLTKNAGETWTIVPTGKLISLTDAVSASSNEIFITGLNGILMKAKIN
ncbi:MAG: protein kinase [Ignavibacteriaceae bacterium]|nr:protein kinase [Ignavibacteriaceae bacterium]